MTKQQAALLQFIARYKADHAGCVPSFAEMAAALNLKAKSGIHKLIVGLEERGFIRRFPGHRRSIRIMRMPGIPTTADSLHEMVARLRRKEGTEVAFAALVDLASDLVPLLADESADAPAPLLPNVTAEQYQRERE